MFKHPRQALILALIVLGPFFGFAEEGDQTESSENSKATQVSAEVEAVAPTKPEDIDESQRYSLAIIEKIIDEKHLLGLSSSPEWTTGQIVTIVSQNSKLGVIAFVEVVGVSQKLPRLFEIKLRLERQSRQSFIQKGDFVRAIRLDRDNPDYVGTTDLIIRDRQMKVAPKYRPLVHQGFVIGDTAQTLSRGEYLFNYFANLYYGLGDNVTVGSLVPANLLGRPNFNFRVKFYDTDSTTLTSGLSFVRLTQEDQASLNLNFYWDNTSSDALISHTFLGLGLISWDKAGDAAALKYLTSSSFQTGYELLLNNWDRFLIGPSYNFEKKALGGYLSYILIYDTLHFQFSVNATDITKVRLDPTDGYYGFFDVFWRF